MRKRTTHSLTRNHQGILFIVSLVMFVILGTLDMESIFQYLTNGYLLIYGLFLKILPITPPGGL